MKTLINFLISLFVSPAVDVTFTPYVKPETMTLLIWPDGGWLYKSDFSEEEFSYLGDDFFEQEAPGDLEDIDDFCWSMAYTMGGEKAADDEFENMILDESIARMS